MKVLFGVHSWGLGHATRSTVVIDGILARGHSVDIISTGRALKVLEKTFGKKCRYFDVPEIFPLYDVKNFSNSKFLIHSPEIVRALLKARRLSKK